MKKYSKSDFLLKAQSIHHGNYLYDKVDYVGSQVRICITCPRHGDFYQFPHAHLQGKGCTYCHDDSIRLGQQRFVAKAKLVHGDSYDYSGVILKTVKDEISLRCHIHGPFIVVAAKHLYRKIGCKLCTKDRSRSRGEMVIENYLLSNGVRYEMEKTFVGLKHKRLLRFDFFLPDFNMVIEFHGRQHYHVVGIFNSKDQIIRDQIKVKYCIDNKIKLLIIPYHETNYIDRVLTESINHDKKY